jgi:Raf kinase inhibitor-like YbhB/YbcL family protein
MSAHMENCRLNDRIRVKMVPVLRHLALIVIFVCSGCLVPGEKGGISSLEVTSGAFEPGGQIPVAYTCDGADIPPPLSWGPVPPGTASMAILVTDPDAPGGTFVHWVAYNIPPGAQGIPAGEHGKDILPEGAIQGTNDMGRTGYGGPCPPRGKPHHYHFTVSALDTTLNLAGKPDGRVLARAMAGHVLARGEIMGLYERA